MMVDVCSGLGAKELLWLSSCQCPLNRVQINKDAHLFIILFRTIKVVTVLRQTPQSALSVSP